MKMIDDRSYELDDDEVKIENLLVKKLWENWNAGKTRPYDEVLDEVIAEIDTDRAILDPAFLEKMAELHGDDQA